MLNERARNLLKTLIERYIADGQPVGSRALSKYSGLELSPASIRNVMADLEEMGLIVAPHTSAGRVPTARGYRFFVDSLLTIRPLAGSDLVQMKDSLHPDDPQKLVATASQLLSELTRFAGVVVTPRRRSSAFRHVEFVQLTERRLLLIIVGSDGDVQNRILMTDRAYSSSELTRAANLLNQNYTGRDFDSIRDRVITELTQLRLDISELMNTVLQTGSEAMREKRDDYVLSGEGNLLHVDDLSSDLANLRQLFDAFESKTTLLQLLEVCQHAQGVKIFIGGESEYGPLDVCSIVAAPYEVDGQVVGSVGVVGPTRMSYERIIPIVDVTARLLSTALSQH